MPRKPPAELDAPPPSFEGFSEGAFKFLSGLKKNNNKEWFEAHRDDYEMQLREPLKALVATLAERFRQEKLPLVANPKTSLFRINRDIRFSKDKSPYKTNAGVWFPIEGTSKEEWGGFYLGFEPATGKDVKVFAGGGVHQPMPQYLKKIRERIASDPKKYEKLLNDEHFREHYPKGIEGERLKRMPAGYTEDHPAAEHLKLKDFTFNNPLTKTDLMNEDLPDLLVKRFKAGLPMVKFLTY